MMWEGISSRSWMMYSPRSVSTGVDAVASSSDSLMPISSPTIDLPLVTVFAPSLPAKVDDRAARVLGRAGKMQMAARAR